MVKAQIKYTEKAPLANEKGCADSPVLLRAGLVAHRAGSLAGGLAGCLTLTAAARVERGLHRRLVDRLDVLHDSFLLNRSSSLILSHKFHLCK